MVRAILDGKKSQTRRVIKPQPVIRSGNYDYGHWSYHTTDAKINVSGSCGTCIGSKKALGDRKDKWVYLGRFSDGFHYDLCSPIKFPYGKVGDQLWVRETWCNINYNDLQHIHKPIYKADFGVESKALEKWKSSLFMPRWASRITLEITNVRVERVQNISEEDAKKEGATMAYWYGTTDINQINLTPNKSSYLNGFANLWYSIHKKDGFDWDANPWVWVISFKRIEERG